MTWLLSVLTLLGLMSMAVYGPRPAGEELAGEEYPEDLPVGGPEDVTLVGH